MRSVPSCHNRAVAPVMTILPPKEHYEPGAAGAIALLVSQLAAPDDCVLGTALRAHPLPGGVFQPLLVRRNSVAGRVLARGRGWYRWACLRKVRAISPALVEVHNCPDIALSLARLIPHVSVRLILHNDPLTMRGLKTVRERQRMGRHVLVCGVSGWVAARYAQGDADEDSDASTRDATRSDALSCHVQSNAIAADSLPAERSRRRLVLFAGRVVADKGVDAFVRAWGAIRQRFPAWEAVIVGADRFGPDSPETPFLRHLRPQAVAASVRMLGYRPHDEVLTLMAEAAVVVVPSRWSEPFGMTALEAMATGSAVIVSPRGALPDVVGDAGLYADPDEPGALETALGVLLNNSDRRHALGQQARKRALSCFGLDAARDRQNALRALAQVRSGTGAH